MSRLTENSKPQEIIADRQLALGLEQRQQSRESTVQLDRMLTTPWSSHSFMSTEPSSDKKPFFISRCLS
jgi:hypothetical protein